MNEELADHISKLAAPIYAAHILRLSRHLFPEEIPNRVREAAMDQSILEAKALWERTLML